MSSCKVQVKFFKWCATAASLRSISAAGATLHSKPIFAYPKARPVPDAALQWCGSGPMAAFQRPPPSERGDDSLASMMRSLAMIVGLYIVHAQLMSIMQVYLLTLLQLPLIEVGNAVCKCPHTRLLENNTEKFSTRKWTVSVCPSFDESPLTPWAPAAYRCYTVRVYVAGTLEWENGMNGFSYKLFAAVPTTVRSARECTSDTYAFCADSNEIIACPVDVVSWVPFSCAARKEGSKIWEIE